MTADADTTLERRVIAHVDADAFYASVHLLEDPSLQGKPVIVAGSGPRSIVTTASYEARAFGVGSAQPTARARQLCPHAVFLTPNFDLYRDYSRRAMAVMEGACDTIEPLSLDEAYLDITTLDNPVRAMRQMIADIHAATGLIYSVGIGPNKLCAKVLSDHKKPRAFNVASREQCCELFADAAPRIIPGIGPKTADTLTALGIETLAALRAADTGLLERRLGARRAGELQARAAFHHAGIVQPHRDVKSVSEETTFDIDIDDDAELEERLGELAVELCERLERKGLRGRTIGIKVRHADFTIATRARTIATPTNDVDDVMDVARQLLREYERPQPLRLLGVRVAAFHRPEPASDHDEPRIGEQLRLRLDLARVEP